ncbi:DNA-binding transcriptional regulator BasR [compost metagenome]
MTSRSIKRTGGAAQTSCRDGLSSTAADLAAPMPALLRALDELNKSCSTAGLVVDGWRVDFQTKCVHTANLKVRLAPIELMVLARLIAAPDSVIRSGEFHSLLARWSGDGQPDELNLRLRVCITKMRAKFAHHGLSAPIVAVRGVGYRFARDEAALTSSKPAPAKAPDPFKDISA